MSSDAQRWLPLLPAAVVSLYFVVGLIAFSIRSAIWGLTHDRDIEASGRSLLIGVYLRNYFSWVVRPLWLLVLASGIPPNGVTVLATLSGCASGVAVAFGRLSLGGWLFILSGILDTLDGKLARARNRVTPAGAAFDSLLDRYADGAVLFGLAIYFRNSWVVVPTLAAIFGTSMVPYVRAKAESMGVAMKDGLMQRPERVFTLGVAVMASPMVEALLPTRGAHTPQRLAAIGLVFLAITSNATAIGRIVRLLAALRGQAHKPAPAIATPGQPRPSNAPPRLVRT
ncbi:MAG TPA: CDP-alcohol phosphatidyltransferase family protein [Polyangia bacterium]